MSSWSRIGATLRHKLGAPAAIAGMLAVGLFQPATAEAAAGTDHLSPGESLTAGQSIVGGGDVLLMQGDGNLVLLATQSIPLWSSNTSGHAGAWAVMQGDGNLVVYTSTGVPLWATGTNGRGASTLFVQNDGNVVVRAGSVASWASNTYRQSFAANRFPGYRWGADQWSALNQLWIRESGWNELAKNRSSGAYGIPQALPASKMAIDGADYLTNPNTQIHWGEDYIAQRYGSPAAAWSHETRYGWY